MVFWYCPNNFPCNILLSQIELSLLHRWLNIFRIRTIVHFVTNLSWFCNQTSYLMTHFTMKKSNNIIPFGLIHVHIKVWSHRWNMETKQWQIPYPTVNWKIRYMVVWIQNHDKFIVLIWKTLDMRFGGKIRINSLHSVQLS